VRGTLSLVAAVIAIAVCPPVALGAEAVTNGGFESGGTGWTPSGYAGYCSNTTCDPDYPYAGVGWGQLGGGAGFTGPLGTPGFLSQSVPVTGTPATLSFYARVITGSAGQFAYLQASVDGQAVGPLIDAMDAAYNSYKLVSVNLAPYADGASHNIAFTFTGQSDQNLIRPTFVIDNVSVSVPFLPTPPTEPTPPTPDPDPTPTPDPDPTPQPQPSSPTCHGKTATKVGTDDAELIEGTPQADVIVAGSGDDVVRTGAGDDIVCGGPGNDELKGASGADRLYGEEGRDKLYGGGGAGDKCVGGPSRDIATRSCEKSKSL
jgi:hypothetical protein